MARPIRATLIQSCLRNRKGIAENFIDRLPIAGSLSSRVPDAGSDSTYGCDQGGAIKCHTYLTGIIDSDHVVESIR